MSVPTPSHIRNLQLIQQQVHIATESLTDTSFNKGANHDKNQLSHIQLIQQIVNKVSHLQNDVKELMHVERRFIDSLSFVSLESDRTMKRILHRQRASNQTDSTPDNDTWKRHRKMYSQMALKLEALENHFVGGMQLFQSEE
mmetsp:Transcript_11301/g.42335  ORF Transcript_11301/g.42335 Transcript_11301/m.42335 type:complete len:142 (+) Transcript_11301:32-457(+)